MLYVSADSYYIWGAKTIIQFIVMDLSIHNNFVYSYLIDVNLANYVKVI